jgi:hypothetical protein
MVPIKTKEQNADIFTKSLHREKFERFQEAFGMVNKATIVRRLP